LPGFEGAWRTCILGEAFPAAQAEPLDGAFGRGGILRAGTVVLRPYRRGGLLRHLNGRTYLSVVRFAAEFAVHRALWTSGFPTVEPVGYAWRPRPIGVEGVYLTRWTEGIPWPRAWDRSPLVLPALKTALGSLCEWGLWAPDLNATNVLVKPDGGILLLDWDRAHFAPGLPSLRRYHARLRRSLLKLGAPAEVAAEFA
jgi:hypothetical protein